MVGDYLLLVCLTYENSIYIFFLSGNAASAKRPYMFVPFHLLSEVMFIAFVSFCFVIGASYVCVCVWSECVRACVCVCVCLCMGV